MSDEPLQSLHHPAVPGYRSVFVITFGVMALYLATILISSSGPSNHHHNSHPTETTTTPAIPQPASTHEAN
jgi:hypothetical protein